MHKIFKLQVEIITKIYQIYFKIKTILLLHDKLNSFYIFYLNFFQIRLKTVFSSCVVMATDHYNNWILYLFGNKPARKK